MTQCNGQSGQGTLQRIIVSQCQENFILITKQKPPWYILGIFSKLIKLKRDIIMSNILSELWKLDKDSCVVVLLCAKCQVNISISF
jgi:hypothetical protein